MITKQTLALVVLCTAVCTGGAVHYLRSQAAKDREIAALRAQVAGRPAAPAPSLGAVQVRPAVAAAEPVQEEEQAPPAEENPFQRVARAPSLADAFRISAPAMDDTVNKSSDGAVMLALWSSMHMKWSDVGVAKNETSVAKILKDSDAERGKRMCLGGAIIQIAKERGVQKLYTGLFHAFYGQGIVNFFAVGDTGELVENSETRLCGVVTGRFTYSNSGGGTTHAISMVGMFDLPGNNPRKQRRASVED